MAAVKELSDEVKRIHAQIKSFQFEKEDIGKRIRKIRESLGLGQKEFEKLVKGSSLDEITNAKGGNSNTSKWELGQNLTDVQTLNAIAIAGGHSLQWLLYGGDEKQKNNKLTIKDIGVALFELAKITNVEFHDYQAPSLQFFYDTEYETTQTQLLEKLFKRVAASVETKEKWVMTDEQLMNAGLADIPPISIDELLKLSQQEIERFKSPIFHQNQNFDDPPF